MPNYAMAVLIGHLGRDTELKYTSEGTAIASNSISVKTGYGNNESTTWWNITLFGRKAELFNEWTKKGQAIQVQGTPYLDSYTNKEGVQGQSLKLNVYEFTTLGRDDSESQQSPQSKPQQKQQSKPSQNNDIPF